MLKAKRINDILSFDRGIRKRIALEMTSSLPIPVRHTVDGQNVLHAHAFYFGQKYHPQTEEADLHPPSWLVRANWETGEIIDIQEKDAAFFNVGRDRFTPFSTVSYRKLAEEANARNLGSVMERLDQVLELYDTLVNRWMQGFASAGNSANRFQLLFTSIVEPPLLPVYQKLGAEFFTWVRTP